MPGSRQIVATVATGPFAERLDQTFTSFAQNKFLELQASAATPRTTKGTTARTVISMGFTPNNMALSSRADATPPASPNASPMTAGRMPSSNSSRSSSAPV